MEEKLLEIMQRNEIKLNKEKEELKKVIEEENSKHKKEIENGKLIKTKEIIECETDLAKIESELNSIVKEKEIIARKQQMEKEIIEEKKKLNKLNKNRKQCQETIKEEQKFSSFSDGKFGKTSELQEYEKDLEKINNELKAKIMSVAKQEKELRILNSYVNKMITKYNVKEQMKKEEETKTAPNKPEEVKTKVSSKEEKEEVPNIEQELKIKTEANDPKEVKTKVGSKEGNKETPKVEQKQEENYLSDEDKVVADKIKKVQDEMKEQNRNYKDINLSVMPQVEKVKLRNEQEPKSAADIEKVVNKVYKQMQEDNRNISNVHLTKNNTVNKEKLKNEQKNNEIKYIEILEKDNNILYIDGNKQEYVISKEKAIEEKRQKFKRLGISKLCKEIAGGRISGNLLKRKINPEIVAVLQNNPEQLKEYITCIKEKRKLPFELVHDLTNLNIIEKFKLNKFVKAEEKTGAKVLSKLFDKNKTFEVTAKTRALASSANKIAKKQITKIKGYKDNVMCNLKAKTKDKMSKLKNKAKDKEKAKKVSRRKDRDFVQKVPNKNSEIEAKAIVALAQKESQKELANGVKEVLGKETGENEIE